METLPDTIYALNEHGTQTRHSEQEVDLALEVLILCGGVLKRAAKILQEDAGLSINRDTLRDWRKRQFPRRHAELRHKLAPEISEDIAGRAMERARLADDAERKYLQAALAKVEQVHPNHLAKSVKALADSKAQNVGIAQLLRDRPTSITKDKTVEDRLATLERLGVLTVDDQTIEGDAVEEPEPAPA